MQTPTPQYDRYNTFRGNIEILNADACRELMDYLESKEGKGQAGNGRFGTNGLKMLANLDVNDYQWEQTKEHILLRFRQRVKEAASQVDHSPDLLKQITGDDWIFEKGDIGKWLEQNPIEKFSA